MTSRKLDMVQVQVLDSDWFKTDHRAVFVVLSLRPKMRYTMRNAVNLRGWEPDDSWHDTATATLTDWKSWNKIGTFACGNSDGSQKVRNQGDVRNRTGAQNTSVGKEENRTEPRAVRIELALSRNLEKENSLETRGASGQDQGECRDVESPQENAEQAFQLEINCKRRKSRICYSIPEDQEELTQSERRHWVELWKNMRMDCAGGMFISPKKLENVLKKAEERERVTGSDHSRCFESIAARMFGKAGEVAIVDVLGHEFPGRLAVFADGDCSESGGCNVLDQVQAYCWTVCDAKCLGLRLAQVAPSTEIRECADCVCAEDACRCCFFFLLLTAAELSREWQREIVVVQLDVKKAFDHVDHRAAFRAMKLQGVNLFSMALIAAIWSGSCMKARLGTVASNKVQMSRGLPQGAPESPVIFTMIMELVLRDLIKSWISRKLAWRLDDFTLGAICYADDVVLIAVSVSAAETMVSEVIEKLKEVRLTVGAQKTRWTSFPKMMDKNIMVDGSAVVWEEVLECV